MRSREQAFHVHRRLKATLPRQRVYLFQRTYSIIQRGGASKPPVRRAARHVRFCVSPSGEHSCTAGKTLDPAPIIRRNAKFAAILMAGAITGLMTGVVNRKTLCFNYNHPSFPMQIRDPFCCNIHYRVITTSRAGKGSLRTPLITRISVNEILMNRMG